MDDNNQYNEINSFLDQCINEALQETTGKFQVGVDNSKEVDFENYQKTDRFEGFKDEIDHEGEKMKDYERPPPYKIYRRPLTAEETRDYKQYEEDMGKLEPGKTRPSWDGFDRNAQAYDKTDEYSESFKNRIKDTKGTGQDYTEPERKQDKTRETYRSSAKTESKRDRTGWDYRNDKKDPQKYYNIKEPKVNPNVYYPPSNTEENAGPEKWTYKPRFSSEDKAKTGYQDTMSERSERYSEAASSKYDPTDELERDQENEKYTKADATKKDKVEEGMMEEDVKRELLKLRPVIMDRAIWGALPPMGTVTPMTPPADTVVFTLNTGTPTCITEEECRRTVREIQARHMGKGLPDIQYNFLVGGDGNLYEGRGWAFESGIKPEKQQGKNYNIAFIGNFQDNIDKIPPEMLGPVQELIVWGNAIKLMTNNTQSAGEYKVQPKSE